MPVVNKLAHIPAAQLCFDVFPVPIDQYGQSAQGNIKAKLGCRNVGELVNYWHQNGLGDGK